MQLDCTIIGVHAGPIYAAAIFSDGSKVMAGGKDAIVREWSVHRPGELLRSLTLPESITAISYGAKTDTAAIAAGDSAYVWANGANPIAHRFPHIGIETVALDPLGNVFASAGAKGVIKLWGVKTDKLIATTTLGSSVILDLQWLADRQEMLVASAEGLVFSIDLATLAVRRVLQMGNHGGPVYRVRRSPDGKTCAAALTFPGHDTIVSPSLRSATNVECYEVAVWDADAAGPDPANNLVGHLGWIGALCFSPGSDRIASGAIDGTIKLWDPYARRLVHDMPAGAGRVHDLVYLPDGQGLIAARDDGRLALWRVPQEPAANAGVPAEIMQRYGGEENKLQRVAALVKELLSQANQRVLEKEIDQLLGVGNSRLNFKRLSSDELASLNAALEIRQERAYREGDHETAQKCQFILQFGSLRISRGLAAPFLFDLALQTVHAEEAGSAEPEATNGGASSSAPHIQESKLVELFKRLLRGEITEEAAIDAVIKARASARSVWVALNELALFGPGQLPADRGGAVTVIRAAYTIAQQLGHLPLQSHSGIILVSVLGQAGKNSEALSVAAKLLKCIDDPMLRAELLSMLGNLYQNTGDARAAIRALNQASDTLGCVDECQRNEKFYETLAGIHNNLGVVHYDLGDLLAQRRALDLADVASLRSNSPFIRASVLQNMGAYYFREGDYDSAEHCYIETLKMDQASARARLTAQLDLANISLRRGDAATAERLALESVAVAQQLKANDVEAMAWHVAGKAAIACGAVSEGMNRLELAIAAAHRSSLIGVIISTECALAWALLEQNPSSDDGYNRLRLVLERVLTRRSVLDAPGDGPGLHQLIFQLTERLISEAMKRGNTSAAWEQTETARAFLLKRAISGSEQSNLARRTVGTNVDGSLGAAREGLKALGRSAVLVTYFVGATGAWAFILRPGDPVVGLCLRTDAAQLVKVVDAFKKEVAGYALYGDIGETWLIGARELVDPLLAHLRPDDHLIVVPSGPMFELPFHAIWTGDARIGLRWPVTILPATTWVEHPFPRRDGPGESAVLLGDFPEEAELVSSILATPSIATKSLTRSQLLQALSAADTIHVTSHGAFCAARPELSGFILKEAGVVSALFSALEKPAYARTEKDQVAIANMEATRELLLCGDDVQIGSLRPGAFVVLSACESGLVHADVAADPVGLLRGLLIGGASMVVATQWRVQPEATTKLLGYFYRTMCDEPDLWSDPAEAMRKAQQRLMTEYSHTFFWASFYVVGGLYIGMAQKRGR